MHQTMVTILRVVCLRIRILIVEGDHLVPKVLVVGLAEVASLSWTIAIREDHIMKVVETGMVETVKLLWMVKAITEVLMIWKLK